MTDLPPTADPLDAAEAANRTHDRARRAMIDSQLRTSGVNAPFVLRRMAQVAREDFVPDANRANAYIDRAIRLDGGGAIAAPVFYGMLLQEADPKGDERTIVVDAGSGYLAELAAPLVGEITVLSPAEAAGKGGKGGDAQLLRGDAQLLLIDGAIETVPTVLAKRLDDGARIVTGLVSNGVTRLAIGRKGTGGVSLFPVHDMGIPRLHQFDVPKGWSF